jgi:uncharacterized membrane protein YdjX (TVP38/TMEM64 family)
MDFMDDMDSMDQPAAPARLSRWGFALKIAAGAAILAALIFLGREAGAHLGTFVEWVDGLGVWGPIVFMLGYAVATVAFVPGSILTMASGVLFGLFYGTIYVIFAATTGATAAFLIARFLARRQIEERIAGNERFAAIDRAIAARGGKIVLLLRLSPAFPFNLLNYALGLTRVPVPQYVLASVGMIPGTFLYVYYGAALGNLTAVAAGTAPERGLEQWIFLGVGLLATIAVTAYVTAVARRALEEATDG